MPKYEVTTKQGIKLQMEGPNPPTDADIDFAVEQLQNEQTDKGFMGQVGKALTGDNSLRPIAGLLDQAGIGVLQGVSELPGLPADLVGLGLQGMDYLGGRKTPTANPLEMFSSRTIRSALGQDGLGLIPRSVPRNAVERTFNAAGQGIGSAGAGGAKGLMGIVGGAGGGVGSQTMKEIFPDSTIAPIAGGILGALLGARSVAGAPAPTAGVADDVLDARIRAGAQTDPPPNTMMEQADMMSEGGPPIPVRPPVQGSTPEQIAEALKAKPIREAVDKITLARGLGPEDAAKSLQSLNPGKPDLVNRVLFNTGLAGKDSAQKIAMYNALQKVEAAQPGAMKDLLAVIAKPGMRVIGHGMTGNKIGMAKAVYDLLRGLAANSANVKLQAALDELETIVRTGEPIPTTGTALKNEAKAIVGQFGPYREPAKRGKLP
jgi:hypothetical protein